MTNAETPARLRTLPSRLLNQTAGYVDRLVTDGLAAVDARKWHYSVLVSLRDFGPTSQATLSRRTGIYRSDMVAVVTELADRDFLRRDPDPDDKRRNVITLTEVGRDRLRNLDKLIDSLQEEVLAPLTPAEREQLVGLLTRLADHHLQHSPPPSHRDWNRSNPPLKRG